MAKLSLKAPVREASEKAAYLRAEKFVPGVVYGKNTEAVSIKVQYSDFLRAFRKAGESTIISLDTGKEKIDVLISNTQKAPVSGDFIHVDFYAITQWEALTANIHFNFIGESQAANEGGILEEQMREVEVKCLPKDLVDHFDVDLSLLKEVWDMIKLSDLGIDSDKYEISHDMEDTVAKVSQAREEEEEEIDLDSVAVTWADEPEAEWEKTEEK